MSSATDMKWYHKIFACTSEIRFMNNKAEVIEVINTREEEEHIDEEDIVEASIFHASMEVKVLKLLRIEHAEYATRWQVRRVRDKMPVWAEGGEFNWKAWDDFNFHGNNFYYIFGKDDSRSKYYITVNRNNRLTLTSNGADPSNSSSITQKDNRLFQGIKLQSARQHFFKHVRTGKFVGTTGEPGRGLLVLVDEANAVPWNIES